MFKNALISVSNKEGLLDFVRPLAEAGMRVVSTGGTSKYLRENGVKVVEVAEQTGFPEVMDGRVRTLHPRIHMALLARANSEEDRNLLKREEIEPFDLVVVNLYPFEGALQKRLSGEELIEYIDIGGPSLPRAAAKNHDRLAVVCDPADYKWVLERKQLNLEDRQRLAAKVFVHTSRYDALIAATLDPGKIENFTLSGRIVQSLRYGENPRQKAIWFRSSGPNDGLHQAEILHGKALSYNNLLDLEAACATLREFFEPCVVAVKHNNPCGVGTGKTIVEAAKKSLSADPTSVFGGIVAFNRELDLASAEELGKLFLECVIAPSFDPAALERLKKKKDLRLLCWPQMIASRTWSQPEYEFRSIAGGFLVQTADQVDSWSEEWQILGEAPNSGLRDDLMLAWRTCAHLKSNAIALAASGQTVGLGMGQVNRVEAVEQAIARWRKYHPERTNVVLASDAFFPFPDSIEQAAEAGIRWIIQPGGSIRDDEVIRRAGELGVNMVLTKVRHFRH